MYLLHGLQENNHECFTVNHNNMSLFDTFDTINPDWYITSIKSVSQDAIEYLSQKRSIGMIVSIKDASNKEVLELEELLLHRKIYCPFFFAPNSDQSMPFAKKIKRIRIMESVDINIISSVKLNYKIDKAVIVNNAERVRNYDSTFHVISNNPAFSSSVDICAPAHIVCGLLKNYDSIIFQDIDTYLPQVFFHALYLNKKVFYDIEDEGIRNRVRTTIDGIFKVGDSLDYQSTNKLKDFSPLQEAVREKHLAKNRVSQILSQLPKQ